MAAGLPLCRCQLCCGGGEDEELGKESWVPDNWRGRAWSVEMGAQILAGTLAVCRSQC